MTVVDWILVVAGLYFVAEALSVFSTGYARRWRELRQQNAIEHLHPWLAGEPYPPTMVGVASALASEASVVEVAIIESKREPRVLVHLRLSWWTVLGFGRFHKHARARAEVVLEQVVPIGVEAKVGEVTVGRLPR